VADAEAVVDTEGLEENVPEEEDVAEPVEVVACKRRPFKRTGWTHGVKNDKRRSRRMYGGGICAVFA
jgi:hypothetical protein